MFQGYYPLLRDAICTYPATVLMVQVQALKPQALISSENYVPGLPALMLHPGHVYPLLPQS